MLSDKDNASWVELKNWAEPQIVTGQAGGRWAVGQWLRDSPWVADVLAAWAGIAWI